MIKFFCMLCGEKLSVQDQLSGKRIKCPKCNNTSVVPTESPRIKFDCPNCGRGIRVLQIHAGKKGQCPKCKSAVVVPSFKADPAGDSGTIAVVCSMCNEKMRAPKDSKERFVECPACGSNVESSVGAESPESDSSIPPGADEDEYEDEYEDQYDPDEEDEAPDRRLIFAICGAAVVVVVGLIILVTVILPSGSGPVEEPDVSLRQQVADADSRPQPVASDTEPAGVFTLDPPKQDAVPEESISSDQESLKQTKIAFVRFRDGNAEIYVMNADGSEQKRLTNSPAQYGIPSFYASLSWSPDGKKVVFMSNRDGTKVIYVMNADGSEHKRLTNDPAANFGPAWSPDGKMAFISLRDGNPEIYIMNADGSEQRRLTRNSLLDESPSWSPDGKKIAFMSKRDGIQDIYVMNADGSEQVNVTNSPVKDGFPSWSPDGKKIAYTSGAGRDTDIYVMNADGTDQENVTNNPAMDGSPCYSPDGKKIVFCSGGSGKVDIYAMRVDGSELENLTNNPSADMFPSWSPFLGSEPLPVASERSAAALSSALKLRLKTGQKRFVRMVKEDKVSQSVMGERQDIISTKTTELEFEVEDVDPNGAMRLKVTYLAIKEKGQGAGEPMQYDSTAPDVSTDYLFGPMYSAMIGQSFMAKVTPEGRVVGLEGVDRMYLAMADTIVQGEDDATRKRISERATEGADERIRRSIERANERYGSRQKRVEAVGDMLKKNPIIAAEQIVQMVGNLIMVYPGRDVEAGDSWQAKKVLFSMGTVDMVCTYTLKEKTPAVAVVGVSSKIDLSNELASAKDSPLGSARTTITGTYEGTVQVDSSSGWMLGKNVTMRCSGEVIMPPNEQMPQGMTLPVTMETVITVEPME